MNVQVLTKNPLILQFLMRKIKRRTFSYLNRKGEKPKALFKNIFNYSFRILFCSQPQACHINVLNANNSSQFIYTFIYEWNPFRVKMSPFSPFLPKPVTLKFFIVFCNINIKHVKFSIYFAIVSLYSKEKNKNADKPSLFLKGLITQNRKCLPRLHVDVLIISTYRLVKCAHASCKVA